MYIARNVWIVKDLQKRASQYKDMTNYYVKFETNDRQHLIMETYRKDEKYSSKLEVLDPDGSKKVFIAYGNGEMVNSYVETSEGKFAVLNNPNGLPSPLTIVDFFDNISTVDLMKTALLSRITTEKYKGKDCYKMYYKNSPYILYSENNIDWNSYFEKETGLLLKTSMTEYEYQFNVVSNEFEIKQSFRE